MNVWEVTIGISPNVHHDHWIILAPTIQAAVKTAFLRLKDDNENEITSVKLLGEAKP